MWLVNAMLWVTLFIVLVGHLIQGWRAERRNRSIGRRARGLQ
jgi:hypothetical protein